MPARAATKIIQQAETDIAVLQVKFKVVEDQINEMKDDLKEVKNSLQAHTDHEIAMFKEIRDGNAAAYKSLSDKISGLEKWRWMMMGAGIVLGSMGFDLLAKLLK